MYTDLTLYYLNQMGIVPWVQRADDAALQQLAPGGGLLIALPTELNGKAQLLFTHVLNYLAITDDDITVLILKDADDLSLHAANKKPLAILNLGLTLTTSITDGGHIISNPSLDYLLAHPASKKQLFQQLGHIKQLLSLKHTDEK